MVLSKTFRELVVLLGEGPDVDAAKWVGLREGKGERESRSEGEEALAVFSVDRRLQKHTLEARIRSTLPKLAAN